jgi:hypothetical protein
MRGVKGSRRGKATTNLVMKRGDQDDQIKKQEADDDEMREKQRMKRNPQEAPFIQILQLFLL